MRNEQQWTEITLDNVKRRFNMQFPLRAIGYLQDFLTKESSYGDKLEMTLRISSTAETCVDIIDGVTYTSKYPNAIVKIPGVIHNYEVAEPREAIYINYDNSLVPEIKKAGLFVHPPVWEVRITPEISEIIRELRELMKHSQEFGSADRIDLLSIKLWQELLLMRDANMKRDDFIEGRLYRIASFLQINLSSNIDFDGLIAENGFSRRSFFRHWKKYFEVSPLQYLRDLKMQEAGRLLQVSDMKIGQIAELLGFDDFAYFCAVFKKYYGSTPLQYRRKNS
tara:strand:+ start:148 stop:987 length:840 start_codon:yes stop_codon:yes gene_type:complete